MLVIRPVRMEDLAQLLELARLSSFGLTTLPKDEDLLQKRIRHSLGGFEKVEAEEPRGESYVFVLEDVTGEKVIGTSGIVSKVGGFEPFYAYQIETTVHASKTLGARKEIRALHLVAEHDGPCEIGSLFLHPDYRRGGNGRLLSLARFLFMADHPEFFDPLVIAELRGVIDEQGRSPFWDALGRHFFDLEFPKADYLSIVNKDFIGDLMPKHPIYLCLLPYEAQQVIGRVHDYTLPALKILEAEGFSFSGMVDIFEAGPVIRAGRDQIRSAHESRCVPVGRITDNQFESAPYIVSNARRDFRACQSPLGLESDGSARLDQRTAEVLKVRVGDTVRYVTLRPSPTGSDPV